MNPFKRKGAAAAALMGALWTGAAIADIKDYEFQLVEKEFKKGNAAVVAVRLVNKRTA